MCFKLSENIGIRFFETNTNNEVVWEKKVEPCDIMVHHQYAIAFKSVCITRLCNQIMFNITLVRTAFRRTRTSIFRKKSRCSFNCIVLAMLNPNLKVYQNHFFILQKNQVDFIINSDIKKLKPLNRYINFLTGPKRVRLSTSNPDKYPGITRI